MNSKLNLNHCALIFQMYANMVNITEESKNIKYKKGRVLFVHPFLFLKFKAT